MANKKKPASDSASARKAAVEALKREQRAKERKKTLLLIGVAVLVGGALIAVPVVQIIGKEEREAKALASFGAPLAQAACNPVQNDKVDAEDSKHLDDPAAAVQYEEAPPSHGQHFAAPAQIGNRAFYTPEDAPPVEQLVHNLEHGYTIAWYMPTMPQAQKDQLAELTGELRDDLDTLQIIAAPWDTQRGTFPTGKQIAFTHWSKPTDPDDYSTSMGRRQYCGQLSGQALVDFMTKYPASDAPEPNIP